MKKLLLFSVFLCVLCGSGFSQNLTTISASNITDLNGSKLAAGQLCFLGTDQQDNPISFQIGGGGQALKRGYCSAVAAGVVTSFTVPNPQFTAPAGVYYRVTVKDSSTGQEVLRYSNVTFAGATFNFDNYAPVNLGSFAGLTGNSVAGNLSVSGNVAATGTVTGSNIPSSILQQIFNSGTGLTQRTALNFFAGLSCADNAGTSRTDCRQGQLNTVTFSATPTFDCSLGSVQKITLTANVTSSSLSNCVVGQSVAFEVCENATGGFTFVQPAGLSQWSPINTAANACSSQQYTFDSTTTAFPDLMPGLTGDVTSSVGSTATTVAKIQGTTVSGTTGTGAVVLGTSPSITTPTLGSPTITTKVDVTETTAPAGLAGADRCYGDSAAHALECSFNNDGFSQIARLGAAQSWGAVNQTNVQLAAPKIGGETISSAPRMWASCTIVILSTSANDLCKLTFDKAVTILRIQGNSDNLPSCTTFPVFRVWDGTTKATAAIAGTGALDSGVVSTNLTATTISIGVDNIWTCTTAPTNTHVQVLYKMQ